MGVGVGVGGVAFVKLQSKIKTLITWVMMSYIREKTKVSLLK